MKDENERANIITTRHKILAAFGYSPKTKSCCRNIVVCTYWFVDQSRVWFFEHFMTILSSFLRHTRPEFFLKSSRIGAHLLSYKSNTTGGLIKIWTGISDKKGSYPSNFFSHPVVLLLFIGRFAVVR